MGKRIEVVMLPTYEKTSSLVLNMDGELEYDDVLSSYQGVTQQHLYFLSDEEIKKGDWYIWLNNNQICEADGMIMTINNHIKNGHIKKIIATTDTSLKTSNFSHYSQDLMKVAVYKDYSLLPRPSYDFIELYVDAFNKGKRIEWVDVEYYRRGLNSEGVDADLTGGAIEHKNDYFVPRVNNDNTINISFNEMNLLGSKILEYCKQYEGTDKYSAVMLGIEFGYNLAMDEISRNNDE